MADEEIDILPKDKGDKFYGFKVSDLQTGGLVVLGLGLAAIAAKVFAPDLFKPQENNQQQKQQEISPQQLAQLRRQIAEQNRLRQQIVADSGGEVDVGEQTINPDYNDSSIEAISSRHEKYNTNAPNIDSFDMGDTEYEPTENDDIDVTANVDPNLHKYVKTIDY